MEMFKVIKQNKEKSKEKTKKDIKQDNNEIEECLDDFTIKNTEKIKIGNKYFDEQTLTRCAIVKLSILNYKIRQICKILRIKSSLAWKWSHNENFYGKYTIIYNCYLNLFLEIFKYIFLNIILNF